MDARVKKLLEKYPPPWREGWHCSDNGSMSRTIEAANGEELYDGESGFLADEAFDVLLALPESE